MPARFAVTGCLLVAVATGARAEDESFADVAAVIRARCLSCHGGTARQGDLSLATGEELLDLGYVDTEDVEASHLLELLTTKDRKVRMPKDADPLAAEEVAAFRRWIAAGAKWPDGVQLKPPDVADLDWWSLKPIRSPNVPEGSAANPVDRFVDARLAERGLKPVGRADPRTLVRRITFDLTGLPPSPEEVDAFLSAHEADPEAAWGELVDRLLDSPAFGEKFGQHWLDLARYAETHGYDKDKLRENAWPYRDWVIRSLNEDVPVSRFVASQIAGDELFPGDPDGIVATGFLAAGPWDFIGHVEVGEGKLDGRIAKHLDRDEMLAAVFNVFLSTTVQCAQCHQHKFDPVRSVDYYRLHATLADVDRADRVFSGLPPERERERQRLLAEIAELDGRRTQLERGTDPKLAKQLAEVDARLGEVKKRFADPTAPAYGYHAQIAKERDTEKWVQVDLGRPRSIGEVRLTPSFDRYADIGPGFGFPVRYRIEASNDPAFETDESFVLLDRTAADQPNPGTNAVVARCEDERAFRYVRVTATRLSERRNDYILAFGELAVVEAGTGTNVARSATVTALDSIEAAPRWGRANLVDGVRYESTAGREVADEFAKLTAEREALRRELRPPEVERELQSLAVELRTRRDRRASFPAGPKVYVVASEFASQGRFVPTKGTPRTIHALHRGDLRSPLAVVTPGAPPLWDGAAVDFDGERPRTDLARYVTSRDNPLLWRSLANRLVQWTLGKPVVATPNDFGRMGGKPSHPELLDFLAARLRDDPRQSMKSIVRLLVTSEAYRRSSRFDEGNATIDAGNALLWRAERRRLTAEELRDSVLVLAGKLRLDDRGGPSFRDFVLEKPQHSPHYEYGKHDPNDSATHRRTVYRFVVRSQPQPMLTTLDCADPSISVPRRDESTTALQALTQWNGRFVEAMSVRFGRRLAEVEGDVVRTACETAWGRPPDDDERRVLGTLLTDHGPETLARVLVNSSAFTYLD